MQRDGVFTSYAIGGVVGATFYLEPSAALGIDIVVGFEARPGSCLISPQPIYDYLTGRAKDMASILQFVDAGVLEADRLEDILTRHGLASRWATFEQRFLGDLPRTSACAVSSKQSAPSAIAWPRCLLPASSRSSINCERAAWS